MLQDTCVIFDQGNFTVQHLLQLLEESGRHFTAQQLHNATTLLYGPEGTSLQVAAVLPHAMVHILDVWARAVKECDPPQLLSTRIPGDMLRLLSVPQVNASLEAVHELQKLSDRVQSEFSMYMDLCLNVMQTDGVSSVSRATAPTNIATTTSSSNSSTITLGGLLDQHGDKHAAALIRSYAERNLWPGITAFKAATILPAIAMQNALSVFAAGHDMAISPQRLAVLSSFSGQLKSVISSPQVQSLLPEQAPRLVGLLDNGLAVVDPRLVQKEQQEHCLDQLQQCYLGLVQQSATDASQPPPPSKALVFTMQQLVSLLEQSGHTFPAQQLQNTTTLLFGQEGTSLQLSVVLRQVMVRIMEVWGVAVKECDSPPWIACTTPHAMLQVLTLPTVGAALGRKEVQELSHLVQSEYSTHINMCFESDRVQPNNSSTTLCELLEHHTDKHAAQRVKNFAEAHFGIVSPATPRPDIVNLQATLVLPVLALHHAMAVFDSAAPSVSERLANVSESLVSILRSPLAESVLAEQARDLATTIQNAPGITADPAERNMLRSQDKQQLSAVQHCYLRLEQQPVSLLGGSPSNAADEMAMPDDVVSFVGGGACIYAILSQHSSIICKGLCYR